MGRPRKKPSNLPPCMVLKHGAYWYIKSNKWTRLSDDLHTALVMHADIVAKRSKIAGDGAESGMVRLINAAMPGILKGKSANTVEQYTIVQAKLLAVFADAEPEDIQPVHIKRLLREWSDTPNMANRRLSVMRQIFEHALDEELIEANPAAGIQRLEEAKRKRYVTDAEYAAIWAEATPDARVMMDLQYLCGQRIEDVLSMRWHDVREDGIYVEPSKVSGSSGAKLLISMSEDLRSVLDAASALPRKRRGETILCTVRGGRKYSYRTAYDMLTGAAERAGVEDFRPNDLRAKCITDAELQGLDSQALGGHTTPQMTLRYIRQRITKTATPPKSIRQKAKVLDSKAENA